ncbi:hypothetical protein IJD44_06255 [bacterium]|nr:hypothetical protein [bacterium]
MMKVEIPYGLIRPQGPSIENVELRATLEKAVEDARLNPSERLALNEKFYPNGGGFKLYSPETDVLEITTFYKKNEPFEIDEYARKVNKLFLDNKSGIVQESFQSSDKGNFQTNLDNALAKLKKVLKGTFE